MALALGAAPLLAQTPAPAPTNSGTTSSASDQGIPGVDPTQSSATKAAETSGNEEILVTGSRIRRPGFDTPNPVVSIGAATIQASGETNLTDFLTRYPALLQSATSAVNSGDHAGIGNTGLNLLNLRNFGAQRTLVLIDGRRQVSGQTGTAAVDINTIPTDLVERVDILTGGASAIYGADGVTGVVNFVLKKNFEGVTARFQNGISGQGDASQRFAAITAGQNFADGRGNIAIAYEYGAQDRLASSDRSYLRGSNQIDFYNNPTGTGYEMVPLKNVRFYDTSRTGGIDIDGDRFPDFDGAGNPFQYGTYVPDIYMQGGSGTLRSDYDSDLEPRIRRHVVDALAHFDVSDKLTLFAEGKYAHVSTFSLAQPTFDYYLYLHSDNPYLPANVKDVLDQTGGIDGQGGFLLNRDNFDLGRRGERDVRNTYRAVVGAKGDLSPNLHYELSYVYGQTTIATHYIGDEYTDRFFAAIDAVTDPATGKPACRIDVDPANGAPFQPLSGQRSLNGQSLTFGPGQCQPLDLFGEGNASSAAINFIRANPVNHSKLTQQVASGSISGDSRDVFSLPGGPVGFALGAEYRRESSNFDPDPIIEQGLTYSNQLAPVSGHFDVKEVFGELNAPLLRDKPFVHDLELGAAYRFSDYSTVGHTSTWKIDGQWAPVRDIMFRGTYSQAVRAPNINELFGAQSSVNEFISDPCAPANIHHGTVDREQNCKTLLAQYGADPDTFQDVNSSNIQGTGQGNANLKEEKARTWTAGMVLRPRFLPGLDASVDWYDIRLKDAINTAGAQDLADLCVDQATINNVFCSSITRENGGANPGRIVDYVVEPQNVAHFSTSGLDLNVNYLLQPDWNYGLFNIRVVGNYLHTLKFIGTPGSPATNLRDATYAPKFNAHADLTWQIHKLTLTYGLSWYDKTLRFSRDEAADPNLVDPKYLYYRDYWQHDIYASYDVNGMFEIYGGVNNVTNRLPDIGTGDQPYPQSAIGRYMFAGAKVKLGKLF